MTERYEIADVDEFSSGESCIITNVEGIEIAVYRIDEEYYALGNYCVHQGGPLCEGDISGRITAEENEFGWDLGYTSDSCYVRCPWHGWLFDIKTGENADADQYRVPTYDVEIEDSTVFVVR